MFTYNDILHKSRPVSRRHPMLISHRAKQFAPFAALKGYEEAIRAQDDRATKGDVPDCPH